MRAFWVFFILTNSVQAYLTKPFIQTQATKGQLSAMSYGEARKLLFGQIQLEKHKGNFIVRDVYCNKDFGKDAGVGPMAIPNHRLINTEHTWPQSRFNPHYNEERQKTDLHHLFPTDNMANGKRSNSIFAEVNGKSLNENCVGSRIGRAYGTNISAFEPPDDHKGNVARAVFYFSVRYDLKVSGIEESYLRRWHETDPVDEKEMIRNNQIEKFQGNRNPFIDFPEYVSQVKDF